MGANASIKSMLRCSSTKHDINLYSIVKAWFLMGVAHMFQNGWCIVAVIQLDHDHIIFTYMYK